MDPAGDPALIVPDRDAALEVLSEYGVSQVRTARAGTAWLGLGPEHACYVAATPEGVRRLAVEARRLEWADATGIPVPAHVQESSGLLVRGRVPVDPVRGPELAAAAVAVTRLLATATLPPQIESSVSRRAGRPWRLPVRLMRGLVRGVPWQEFRRVRVEAWELPATVLAHGDFQDDNLLWDAEQHRLHVIDWDYAGMHPPGTDLLNLWVQLVDDPTRQLVLEAAVADAPDRAALVVLAHWLALRHLAEVATGQPGPAGAAAWRDRLRNARASLSRARRLRYGG